MTTCIHLAFTAKFIPLHAASPRSCQHSRVCRMDNLLHAESPGGLTASVQIENRTDKVGLCNFLSPFSGMHFLQPRTVVARFGMIS